MHVSPSTLSRQIQRLEEDLGQPLFVRDNRTVTLTEAGEELRIFAQQTFVDGLTCMARALRPKWRLSARCRNIFRSRKSTDSTPPFYIADIAT